MLLNVFTSLLSISIHLTRTECGFLSNEEDVRLLQTEEYQNKLVEGIVDGVEAYYEEREK